MMLLLCALSANATETDTIGGDGTYNNNGEMMKLVAIDVTEAAVITELAFAVYNYGSESTIQFVLYEEDENDPTSFVLVSSGDGVAEVDPDTQGWASSGPVQWVLEPGGVYIMGVWIESDWYYYYNEQDTDFPWFGEVLGGCRVEEEVPESITPTLEDFYYWMQIVSEDADVDDDGVVALQWGGGDCDDENAEIGVATEEIPYDGLDQDCDGSDLVDVDGDGAAAQEAGGEDCDDARAEIGPEIEEVCGDGVDNDCSGADATCGKDDGITTPGSCSCSSPGGAGGLGFLGMLMGLIGLRRRRS